MKVMIILIPTLYLPISLVVAEELGLAAGLALFLGLGELVVRVAGYDA